MKAQIGEMITGDFEENTLTLQIEGEMTIQAGRYAIVPIDDYEKLVNGLSTSDEALPIGGVVGRSEQLPCKHPTEDIKMLWGYSKCMRCGKEFE